MELILWRHSDAEAGEPDLARKLTAKGEQQAARMADWLHARLPASARIYASPAVRTQQTVAALTRLSNRKCETLDALAPDTSADEVLQAIDWDTAPDSVVVVGHQPTLGDVVARLLGRPQHAMSIQKGSICWLTSGGRDGEQKFAVHAVVNPDSV